MVDLLRGAPAPPDSDDSIASLVNSLRRLVNAMYAASRETQHAHGVTAAQLFILSCVRRSPNLSINGLAELTMTHQSTVSVVVGRLVRKKLLEKRRAADDARRVELVLTPAGRDIVETSPEAFQLRLQRVLATLDDADRAALSTALTKLVAGVGADAAPSGMFFESIDE